MSKRSQPSQKKFKIDSNTTLHPMTTENSKIELNTDLNPLDEPVMALSHRRIEKSTPMSLVTKDNIKELTQEFYEFQQ